eukprot:CAMPEP_0113591002 /NCGR_PEP_ID=MMETSP0015_2-20120614/37004_1 /TAXON_ID=2838 /ORGANISM="Odontella" /LENGTH=227 /DNA_ID=CAMNT_0000497289 /DNA_START=295 /DNA_END=975 /DNA_ORIENTATION=+ /assembly_acc=CAM_ASM_000160
MEANEEDDGGGGGGGAAQREGGGEGPEEVDGAEGAAAALALAAALGEDHDEDEDEGYNAGDDDDHDDHDDDDDEEGSASRARISVVRVPLLDNPPSADAEGAMLPPPPPALPVRGSFHPEGILVALPPGDYDSPQSSSDVGDGERAAGEAAAFRRHRAEWRARVSRVEGWDNYDGSGSGELFAEAEGLLNEVTRGDGDDDGEEENDDEEEYESARETEDAAVPGAAG